MDINKQLKWCMRLIIMMFILGGIGLAFVFSTMFATHSSSGYVEGDFVKYVRNEVRYVSLEELGINPEEVTEGEEISLMLDASGEVIGSEISRYRTIRKNIGLVCLAIATLVFPLLIAIIRTSGEGQFRIGEAPNIFYQTYLLGNQVYFCRWFSPEGGNIKDIEERRYEKGEILSLVKVYKAKRYTHLTKMKVRLHDGLHAKEWTRKIWIASFSYDEIKHFL